MFVGVLFVPRLTEHPVLRVVQTPPVIAPLRRAFHARPFALGARYNVAFVHGPYLGDVEVGKSFALPDGGVEVSVLGPNDDGGFTFAVGEEIASVMHHGPEVVRVTKTVHVHFRHHF